MDKLFAALLSLACIGGTLGGCPKSLVADCHGSLPAPLGLQSFSALAAAAARAQPAAEDAAARTAGTAGDVFGLPSARGVERVCAIYQGLAGCAQPLSRRCGPEPAARYARFREAYNDLCSTVGRISHRSHGPCLTNSSALDAAMAGCLGALGRSLEQVVIPEANASAAARTATRRANRDALCRSREALKVCALGAVDRACGQYAREFWFRFSFPGDSNQDPAAACRQERPRPVNESVWLVCADGSAVVPRSYVCDYEADCLSGEDEQACDFRAAPARLSTAVIVGMAAGGVALVVLVICAVKLKREREFRREYKSAPTEDKPSIEA